MKICKIAAVAVSVIVLAGVLTGCMGVVFSAYSNSEKYSVGDAQISEKVENVEIEWTSGEVNIKTHSENTVDISEKTEKELSEDLRVHWWLDGSTLRIKFAASGVKLASFGMGEKELTLSLPEEIKLSDVTVNTTSADIFADYLVSDTVSASSTSGVIELTCRANQIRLSSTSGGIDIAQDGETEELKIESTSGAVYADCENVAAASVKTTSGKIDIIAKEIDKLKADSTSGKINLDIEKLPQDSTFHSTSGKVLLKVPEESDFTATVSTTSGDFDSDLALKKNGNTYVCGNGDAKIRIDTTSGDVCINAK